ncbi:hypothetical protein [Bremerella sp. P1]|uniref:hypothetical protein n=1 Tax=Bremerella sp. P1 TaxID=3026424 RepID=UPI002367A0D8|nr:hypothetical protein [Bremerella sp. P1]WDI44620.1 hypothetical protein PSR63_11810 [Bremerella sp. P1]
MGLRGHLNFFIDNSYLGDTLWAVTKSRYLDFGAENRENKIFCLCTGSCGSGYITELFKSNNVPGCYHEKHPSLDHVGVDYAIRSKNRSYIKGLLYLTRHDVQFEANNRFFALAPLLNEVFPNSKFIHLHRSAKDTLTSSMNKKSFEDFWNSKRLRYCSFLSGSPELTTFEKACWYWTNINQRIIDDLRDLPSMELSFDDLVVGNLAELEEFTSIDFDTKKIQPVNTKQKQKLETPKYKSYDEWPDEFKQRFDDICGSLQAKLGYS